MKLVGTLVLFLAAAWADVVKDGQCPNVKAAANFDIESYQGTWYEIKKLPIANAANGECATVEYTYDAYNDLLRYKGGHITEEGLQKTVSGVLTRATPTSDAKLTLTSIVQDYIRSGPYWVISTDYKNYAIVYSCTYYEKSDQHKVYLWILSRTKTLSPGSQAIVNNFLNDHSSDFDPSRFVVTDQSDKACYYKRSHPYTTPFEQRATKCY